MENLVMAAQTITQAFPHHRKISKEVAKRIGYWVQELDVPVSSETGTGDDKKPETKKVYVLRSPEGVIWYHGQKVAPVKDQMFELEAAPSEDEAWERDCPDYFHDFGMSFSLLKSIPYHSIRLMTLDNGSGPKDNWEITYRPYPDKATYIELGPFLTVLIVNVFLECNQEVSESEAAPVN
jgi:hypothetical protein